MLMCISLCLNKERVKKKLKKNWKTVRIVRRGGSQFNRRCTRKQNERKPTPVFVY